MHALRALLNYGLIIGLSLVLAACAGPGRQRGATPGPDSMAGAVPSAAWRDNGRLVLEYAAPGGPLFLAAEWTTDDLRPDRHNYRAAHLEAWEPGPDPAAGSRQESNHVKLMSAAEWTAITRSIMQELVPPHTQGAIAFYAQGLPMLAQRRADGSLHIARRSAAAQPDTVTAVLDEDHFAVLAEQVISRRYPELVQVPLLFPTGEGDDAYVLFDLPKRLSVFIVRPVGLSGEMLGQSLAYGLRLADAIVLRGHLLAFVTRPMTTVTQLLSYTWHTTVALLPGSAGPGDAAIVPLAMGEGMDLDSFESRLDDLGLSPRSRGRMRFLIDGPAFFDAFTEAVQNARHSIKVRVYIFGTDDYALRIADLLKARSEALKVKILVDYFGTLTAGRAQHGGAVVATPPASILDYLAAGSRVRARASSNTWLTGDHTKTMILDGQLAFIGGMNIDRQYRYDWHDMMAEVRGPIVQQLEADFDAQWAASGLGGDFARLLARAKARVHPEAAPAAADVEMRALYTVPGDAQILRAQLEAIRSARRYIYLQNPYVTDDDIVAELISARHRGVDVRVILPGRSDVAFMASANLVAASALVSNGVRVYAYPGMTHLKAALIDGWTCIGSANLDKLSLRLNLETNLATSDPGVAKALLTQLFEPDFARSQELGSPPALGVGTYLGNFIADHL